MASKRISNVGVALRCLSYQRTLCIVHVHATQVVGGGSSPDRKSTDVLDFFGHATKPEPQVGS
jgi:hypothetical protein